MVPPASLCLAAAAARGPNSTSFLLILYSVDVNSFSLSVPLINNPRSSLSFVGYSRRSSLHRPSSSALNASIPSRPNAATARITPSSMPSRVMTIRVGAPEPPFFFSSSHAAAAAAALSPASAVDIMSSLAAHAATSPTSSKSTTASFGLPSGTNPK